MAKENKQIIKTWEYRYQKYFLEAIEANKIERAAKKQKILRFIETLRQSNEILLEFEEAIWNATIELVKGNSHETITFIFKDGTEIYWEI